MTLDYAIDIYTDKILDNETVDFNEFKIQLSLEDYKVFLDEIETVNILLSYRETKKCEQIFNKINDYVASTHFIKQAANFRSEELDDLEIQEINDIFDGLFND